MKHVLTLAAAALFCAAPLRADPGPLTVFAAASLRGALEEITLDRDTPVTISYGGSGTMARQVAAGAPADLVILASEAWMSWLATQEVRNLSASEPLTGNSLVVIAAQGTPALSGPADLVARLEGGYLAIGQRDAVPAGSYARQWLQTAGIWDAVTPHLAETDNVRAALALVAQGQAQFGVVYGSDTVAEPAVSVVFEIPAKAHDAIVYPAAALTPAGARFLDELQAEPAQAILADWGFTPAAE